MFWLGCRGLGLLGGLGWLLGHGLVTAAFWGLLIALVIVALRTRRAERMPAAGNAALDILNARYARGEIGKAEYEQIRHDIT